MAWRRRSTSRDIEVELEEFDAEQLLQGLIDADWLTEKEAEAITARAKAGNLDPLPIGSKGISLDVEELALANIEMAAGRKSESLIHLERALGRDWTGRLQ